MELLWKRVMERLTWHFPIKIPSTLVYNMYDPFPFSLFLFRYNHYPPGRLTRRLRRLSKHLHQYPKATLFEEKRRLHMMFSFHFGVISIVCCLKISDFVPPSPPSLSLFVLDTPLPPLRLRFCPVIIWIHHMVHRYTKFLI